MELGVVAALGFAAAFLMSWLVQPHFRNLGFLTEIVDHPGYRRPHREPVPRTGGMAIFISFFCVLYFLQKVILLTELPWSWLGILFGAGVAILALGVGDDRFGIHAEKKLYGQLLVIVVLMIFGQRLDAVVLPGIGTLSLGGWAWPFTMFWYLGFINSMNLIDGLDGLASGISILASLTLVAVSMALGQIDSTLFSATLCGATVAFFYWNISNRKIFLGDSGSMWMGLALASLMLNLSRKTGVGLPVLLAPMIVPIWDTGTTILRRYRRRTSIFLADDFHLHHRLLRLGFSPRGAVLCLLLVTMGTILFALSDFLKLPWLGLPAMGAWMWAAQLGALRHFQNRQYGLDFFSEISYALGLDDRLDILTGRIGQDVAHIIDLQTERQKVALAKGVVLEGTTGAEATIEVVPPGKPRRPVRPQGGSAQDAVLPSAEELQR